MMSKRLSIFVGLLLAVTGAVHAQDRTGQPAMSPDERARLEADLRAARERLEAAAREVANLSSRLTGPAVYDYIIGHRVGRGAMLGVGIDSAGGQDGVKVESVSPDGPAEKAGVKVGDVIVSVDGTSLKDGKPNPAVALQWHMLTVEPGQKVTLEILRDGRKQTVEVTAGPRSDAHGPVLGFNFPRLQIDQFEHLDPEGHGAIIRFNRLIGTDVLDMELVTLTPRLGRYFGAERGVLLVKAPSNSAFKLEEGDVILEIDGREPQSGSHAIRILRSYQPGEELTFSILRDRKQMKLTVTMPEPEQPARRPREARPLAEPPRTFKVPPPPPGRGQAT